MEFNKQNYSQAKQEVIDLIKQTHDWQKTEGFLADGIIAPDIYEQQHLKVLIMLGESYGFDACEDVSIEDQLAKDILGVGYHKRQTARKIPALLWLIFAALEKGSPLLYDDFPDFFMTSNENYQMLQETLAKIAWVNVKKASRHIDKWGNGATNQNYGEVYHSCYKNKAILQMQIEAIAPDLIIVCSDPVFNGLHDTGLLGKGVYRGKKNKVQQNDKGQLIIHLTHPSHYGTWGYVHILKKHEIIYDALINKHRQEVSK